ncbi:MAG: fumarylacetoacetate hydrolase family protein [Nevskiales bacterium]
MSKYIIPAGARIFCIGRNYAKHIEELRHQDAAKCVVFMKPVTSLVPPGAAVVLPRDQGAVHHEAELVVMIGKGGKNISRKKAFRHIGGVTLGLDLTLRDLQNKLKSEGSPWERCKAFDGAAPIGELQTYDEKLDLTNLEFTCAVNGELRQKGNTRDMLYPVAQIIEILSHSWTLQAGDLIYTGTPEGVGPLVPRDRVELASPQLSDSWAWQLD